MTSLQKIFPLLCLILLSGCVVKNVGTTVEHTFKGDYYLTSGKYEEGRASFAREVQENPESALAHYYYGRFLLQDDDYKLGAGTSQKGPGSGSPECRLPFLDRRGFWWTQ